MSLPIINAFWIGSRLGAIHAACLKSFVRHGHAVILHIYDEPEDAPAGVKLSSAENLLPRSKIFRNRATGSLGPFADLIRYEILRQGLGLYVDCDVYCVKPFVDAEYIFASQDNVYINNAILKLPTDCAALTELCELKEITSPAQSWLYTPGKRIRKRAKFAVKRVFSRALSPLEVLPFSALGPQALTHYLKKHHLSEKALPNDVFYPLHWKQAHRLFDPDFRIESVFSDNTVGLHLYNESIRQTLNEPIREGCTLDRVIQGTL